jgi:hypothetical protein
MGDSILSLPSVGKGLQALTLSGKRQSGRYTERLLYIHPNEGCYIDKLLYIRQFGVDIQQLICPSPETGEMNSKDLYNKLLGFKPKDVTLDKTMHLHYLKDRV